MRDETQLLRGEGAPTARRLPAQRRSIARVERILAAASELIAMTGSEQVKMSDVAARAEISIGSLYQYFPEKGALIRTLAERYNLESRRCVEAALANVENTASLLKAYETLVDQYFAMVTAEPVMRDIWSGMQADKQLLQLQLAESRVCGEMLLRAMQRAHPAIVADEMRATAFLIWELGEAAVRLAITVEPVEGRSLIESFKRITSRALADPPDSRPTRGGARNRADRL